MDEFEKHLADYFTAPELVDVLGITTEELIDFLWEHIEEKKEELSEFIGYGN